MENAQAFIYVGTGMLSFSIGGTDYVASPGDKIIVPAGNEYIKTLIGLGYLQAPTYQVSADKPEGGEHKPAPLADLAPDAEDPRPGNTNRRR